MTTSEIIGQVGLVTALSQEYSAVSSAIAPACEQLVATQSGMGRAAGFLAAEKLGREHPNLAGLVSIGFCGALDAGLKTGSIILPSAIITADDETFETDAAWITEIASGLNGLPVVAGRKLYCATEMIETAAGKQAINDKTGACAVDMESAGIAQAAVRFNIPFVAVRIVLDEVSDTLPQATRNAVKADGNVDIGGLMRGIAGRPQEIGGLAKLGAKTAKAQKQLKAACGRLLPGFRQSQI
jgi:nucleoside phosphorylase